MPTNPLQKVIAIVGPTAVGKTALSVEIAHSLNGEVVSADSRQVYRGLDIGSGKVTKDEMRGVPHHLLDVADPQHPFTASDFVRLGTKALEGIYKRGNIPLVVGGTGFYIDALLGRSIVAPVPPNTALREELEALPLTTLQEKLKDCDEEKYHSIDLKNPRRVVRAIEIALYEKEYGAPAPKTSPHYDELWLGVTLPIPALREKIRARLIARLKEGMLDEAKGLAAGGLSFERMDELGLEYRYMARHLRGDISHEEMEQCIESESVKYARRQMTWFKRNKEITWLAPDETERAVLLVKDFIAITAE